MKIVEVNNYEEMSQIACNYIIEKLVSLEKPVLGLATGSTPEGLYRHLVEAYKKGKVSFQKVKTFNLDEYINLDHKDSNSYRYYMNEKLFDYIDILKENIYLPNGKALNLDAECINYENKIYQAGKINIQILGLGLNGHIGFNEPGTPFTSRTHVVPLDESTRIANARFFPSIDDVPTHAITMGIETIMESQEILLLVSGKQKVDALNRLINGEVSEEFPASILQRHKQVTIIADAAACGKR